MAVRFVDSTKNKIIKLNAYLLRLHKNAFVLIGKYKESFYVTRIAN